MKICLSIGYPLKTSRSPIIHNAGYKKLGIDDRFIFLSSEVKPENLQLAIMGIRGLQIKGVSVTMPYKQAVMRYLDKIDQEAEKIGAVNTIVNSNGKLAGFNTDWIGAMIALEKRINLAGKKVAVLGAGGAARAIVYGLTKKKANVKIFNRSHSKAKQLACDFGCEYAGLNQIKEIAAMDIVINATSVGMNEDVSLINKNILNIHQIVFDIVYSPKETRLIKEAKAKGTKVILGYEMLLYQAVEQFRLYTGFAAPVKAMEKALIKDLS